MCTRRHEYVRKRQMAQDAIKGMNLDAFGTGEERNRSKSNTKCEEANAQR
jgi:hypothetical protein